MAQENPQTDKKQERGSAHGAGGARHRLRGEAGSRLGLLAAGRELFAFYLLLWELALSTDLADGVPAWSAATVPQH